MCPKMQSDWKLKHSLTQKYQVNSNTLQYHLTRQQIHAFVEVHTHTWIKLSPSEPQHGCGPELCERRSKVMIVPSDSRWRRILVVIESHPAASGPSAAAAHAASHLRLSHGATQAVFTAGTFGLVQLEHSHNVSTFCTWGGSAVERRRAQTRPLALSHGSPSVRHPTRSLQKLLRTWSSCRHLTP